MKKIYTKEEKTKLVAKGEARLGLKFFYTPEVVIPVVEQSVINVVIVAADHGTGCVCEWCFNVRLDALIASSEKSLNDMKNSLAQREALESVVVEENPYTEPFAAAVVNVSTIPEYKGSR